MTSEVSLYEKVATKFLCRPKASVVAMKDPLHQYGGRSFHKNALHPITKGRTITVCHDVAMIENR